MKKIIICGSKETKQDIEDMKNQVSILKKLGYKVFNLSNIIVDSESKVKSLNYFVKYIVKSDYVYFMDNHVESEDCYLEAQIAYQLGTKAIYQNK